MAFYKGKNKVMDKRVFCSVCFALFCSSMAVADPRLLESFGDAMNSSVVYDKAIHDPRMECSQLLSYGSYEYTIISAVKTSPTSADIASYCKVHGLISPEVQFWLFLPDGWNGRFYMQGHGEFGGIPPSEAPYEAKIDNALRHNFAVAFTNTGHDAAHEPRATFAHNEVRKTIDYGYRSVHVTALASKALLSDYYGNEADYSYWDGCSTGGRQGLMEAQRFPEDFDGILVGAPVNNLINLQIWKTWVYQKLETTPLPPEKVVDILAPRIYKMCDGLDGLEDGLIQDPRNCSFKPSEHLPVCETEDGVDCFTSDEITMLEAIYGPVMSRGEPFFPGLQLGTEPEGVHNLDPDHPVETGWTVYLTDDEGGPGRMGPNANQIFRYLVFDDPNYHWRKFDFDHDPYTKSIARARALLDATATDLKSFKERGNKIISYHGWADVGPPASFTVKYYEDVMAEMGQQGTKEFYSLYMVPGMFHCGGGFGTDFFDAMTPLINWVEAGTAPGPIIARQREDGEPSGEVIRTRPLCPFPEHARYVGDGNPDRAENFTCTNGL